MNSREQEQLDRIEARLTRIEAFTEELRGLLALYVKVGSNRFVAALTRRRGGEH